MQQPENLLVVFFGMIATGKSYLASAWAKQNDYPYYNSDRVRKKLAGLTPETKQQENVGKGIYTPEFSRLTYDALRDHALHHFLENKKTTVVLDGSYQSLDERNLLRTAIADQASVIFVHCFCSEKVVQERLCVRASDPKAVSDGNWTIYLAQKKHFQPVRKDEHVVDIDTDASLEQLMAQVTTKIRVL